MTIVPNTQLPTIETKILKTIENMSLSLQEELLHYAEYLQDKYVLTRNNDVLEDLSQAWHEAMKGKTKLYLYRNFGMNLMMKTFFR